MVFVVLDEPEKVIVTVPDSGLGPVVSKPPAEINACANVSLHVPVLVTSAFVPFEYCAVAVNCWVAPPVLRLTAIGLKASVIDGVPFVIALEE